MIIECIAITGIILAISVIFLRARKRTYALSTLPLAIVPVINIVEGVLARLVMHISSLDRLTTFVFINIVAAAVSCLFVGVMTMKFRMKRTKAAYMVLTLLFNIILVMILIQNAIAAFA